MIEYEKLTIKELDKLLEEFKMAKKYILSLKKLKLKE